VKDYRRVGVLLYRRYRGSGVLRLVDGLHFTDLIDLEKQHAEHRYIAKSAIMMGLNFKKEAPWIA
jgi:hypothetical protein